MKLHHILAVESGIKKKSADKLTVVYKAFQKPDLFNGHVKTFSPRFDPDSQNYENLPEDRKNVQQHVGASVKLIREHHVELFDLAFRRDVTNCIAKADIVVDGKTLVKDAPVTYLLWLGHQLDDLHAEVSKIPTLDPAEKWKHDKEQNLYATNTPLPIVP